MSKCVEWGTVKRLVRLFPLAAVLAGSAIFDQTGTYIPIIRAKKTFVHEIT